MAHGELPMSAAGGDFNEIRRSFKWHIPEYDNIGTDTCDKWAERDPSRPAIIEVDSRGDSREHDFGMLRAVEPAGQRAGQRAGRWPLTGDRGNADDHDRQDRPRRAGQLRSWAGKSRPF
ncbi:hypothetical protein IT41_17215 [Paracoccus halophilus]|uniref:Uncharacterized protein n=1 Tax=Paracoccus halophilus TaxID=376733 RepID=A0A099EX82_9RHOB|nr:hypothetical protein [Paracoccus halophilus]KGJ02532.1 hypothetical protein IT41_17215 [Paracoccus halophilus]